MSQNQDEIEQEKTAQGRVSLPQFPTATTALDIPRIAILSRRKRLARGGDLPKDDYLVGVANDRPTDSVKKLSTILQPWANQVSVQRVME